MSVRFSEKRNPTVGWNADEDQIDISFVPLNHLETAGETETDAKSSSVKQENNYQRRYQKHKENNNNNSTVAVTMVKKKVDIDNSGASDDKGESNGYYVANGNAGDTKIIDPKFNQVTKGDDGKDKKKKGKKDKKKDKENEVPAVPPVPYFSLFRYSSGFDKFIFGIGLICAAIAGCCTPAMVILFGDIAESMVTSGTDNSKICEKYNITMPEPGSSTAAPDMQRQKEVLVEEVGKFSLYMLGLGIATLVLLYTFITCFNTVSENQVNRIRKKYLQGLLRQNVGWYDCVQDKNFVSRIAEDLVKIEEATGEKLGLCIFFMAVSLLSLANAFAHGWKLTLVVLSSAPVLAIATGIVASIQSKLTTDEQGSYAKAGKVVEEAITNIKTVKAFSGQEKEIMRYADGLSLAQTSGKKRGIISGIGVGLMWFIIYSSYALAFWYGTKLILENREKLCKGQDVEYGPDNLLIVFFSVLMGAFNIGQAGSYFEAFASGRGAAGGIFNVIDRIPEIDSFSEKGKKPANKPSGQIVFKDVEFTYPSRVDVPIMKGFNLIIQPGQTVALVGHSGCGKSTALQLLQRFYDPSKGSISLDGEDIRDLNIGWLRSQIGVVSQEPVLFNTTIRANIEYGREGITQKEIEDACRLSNAHGFVSKLPDGYDTLVGDRGAQLSGGQKQRIAIARALVRNPSILLLDEATSALDTQSESVVQSALDNARIGRTTLIVAHRLTTIRAADVIVSINQGQVEETGTHSELLENKGLYFQLVTTQVHDNEESEENSEEETEEVKDDTPARKPSLIRSRSKSIPDDEDVLPYIPALTEDSLDESVLAKEAPVRRLIAYNKPEWGYITMGTLMAIVQGCILPFYALIFGEYLKALSAEEDEAKKTSDLLAILFLVIGILAGVSQFTQIFAFTFSGEALTLRLRKLSFAAMLNQEMGWFDDPSRSIGALCSRLSGDAASVNGATGSRIGSLVQAVATITLCCAMAMYQLPKLGAVALAFVPIVLVGTYFEGKFMTGQNIGEKKAIEDGSKVAVEAVSNIRTVASLCKERKFVQMYDERLTGPHRANLRKAHIRGLVFGVAQSVPLFAYATVMYYGSILIRDDGAEYDRIFKVAESLIFGTMMVGQTMAFAPNYNKAKISGARIVKLLDRVPTIDLSPSVGTTVKKAEGSVAFEHVGFSYPTRPTAKILRSLSLAVQPGKSVAIVGPSGSGKSTCVQLILRFYDPTSGSVKLDDKNIKDLNVNSMLSHIAIVAQEPSLFDLTLRENIAYGDNSREISMEEIIKAARMANIHNFIASLPAGYETRVGDLGSQLSGGQKQRVAIARSLISNPKILLLDEATSALDTESEMVVQAALEAASKDRTSITIAHRLSSIINCDCILVVNNGKLAESGTHAELLQKGGLYHKLWNMQTTLGSNNKDKDKSE